MASSVRDEEDDTEKQERAPFFQGSGSVADAVDRLLDGSTRYLTAVHAAFIRFQEPPPASVIPKECLLSALRLFLQTLAEELDPKPGKLLFRPVEQEDLEAILEYDTSPEIVDVPIDIDRFEQLARRLIKRVALDRGKRLGLFMLGGVMLVHMAKSVVKKVPFIGGPLGCFVDVLLPTTFIGPAVGVAGAIYL
ncbi:hypothetical protein SELMODRAFT_415324 [Selaginella moellendorffii]|uniref:Uncharacterized protein n=1 Tax=Selaginella moellendorffii TaxID=88036 RepID=D8RVR8_SELML|nr:uncharacterized protein LOC9629079 [Selaginella moellendorffii]XP_002977627.1 uncharacterized protein LOC9656164 [Selaginella moellendorffii]EFJ21631.1 hypothetical protein SELMODRAFT_417514 [Selaginella moellendorffii]EFJ24004.1 hypothetical protein SELMODRAFT_415324 [Selaginella moellendorffii]|eukprot:XP_002975219.1 uncharacterized protein LOC9629079 [Selaginella moellendorffii]